MHIGKIEKLLEMSGDERFYYFIRKVADFEEVWGLYDNGWAMTSDDEGNESFPFWPEKELSNLCTKDTWKDYQPKKIDLEHFMSKWLIGMEKDGILAAIFPTPKNKGVIIQPKELLSSLEEELTQYE